MNITVYLGANAGNDPALAEAVRELGSWIGANGHRLVYGGSRSGLMGQLAHFQIYEDKAFQNIIIKNQVDEKVLPIQCKPFLARHK